MPFDYHSIADAPKRALNLVEDCEKRNMLEEFVDSTRPLVESAAREALQTIAEDINLQLPPQLKLRLIQGGSRLMAEVVSTSEAPSSTRMGRFDGDYISRVLVRMPSAVKERAAESAKRAGISLNSWTVSTLERALENVRQYQTQEQPKNGVADRKKHAAEDSETEAEGGNLESDHAAQ